MKFYCVTLTVEPTITVTVISIPIVRRLVTSFLIDFFYRATAYSITLSATLSAIARPSVCLSVCPSHGWIGQKRLKLGIWNVQYTVSPPL